MVTEAIHGFCHMANLARFILVLVSSFRMLLISLIRMVMPPFAELLEFQEMIKRQSISHAEDSRKESNPIIVSALRNPKLPSAERRIDRLIDEGTIVIFAGTETTSRALSVGMFYLLSEKVHIQRIREELKALPSKPDQYSTLQLELLPYLVRIPPHMLRRILPKNLTNFGIYRRVLYVRPFAYRLVLWLAFHGSLQTKNCSTTIS